MEQLEPRYEIPHRTTFSRSVIPSIYEEVKQKVRGKLIDLQIDTKIALTTDMWTSEANEAYLGLTSHYITNDFKLVPVCLAVQQFTGRHTGINISSCLTQMLSDYSIDNSSVSAVITDNAANVDLAMRLGQWSSRHCFGHTLQLAIEDGLKISPAVQAMLKSAKAIVSFYHRSTKGMEKLKELQV